MQRDYEHSLHGTDPADIAGPIPGQPAVGTDPTQGKGSSAWQQALKMGLQINARNRRN